MLSRQKLGQSRLILPVLPLRDVVVYPHMVIPLFVGRERSVKALEIAMARDQRVFLVAQKKPSQDFPEATSLEHSSLYQVGTIAQVLQLLKLPDGTLKILVEGEGRATVSEYRDAETFLEAELILFEEDERTLTDREITHIMKWIRPLLSQFEQYVKLNKKIPPEVISALSNVDAPDRIVDSIAAHMSLKIEDRQKLLEATLLDRIEKLLIFLAAEIEALQVEKKIRSRVKGQMEKNQKEYYLNEQMKAIQKELGDLEGGFTEFENLEKQIKTAKMPKEAHDKAMAELRKLRSMSSMSSEASVCRNYIETMISVPWSKGTKLALDLKKAKKILDEDHYGLEEVKERILENLAVQQRVNKIKGPILCLVGPPGVGKTSLGASIARATGREFARIALGGVRDEAEIRGHRRTYVGSMPGKIIQKMCKVKVNNPLFLLDEIDKMSADFRGDPSSALLEVLDPEQNHTFNDHYIEVDYDLSEVMFVATSNSLNIPGPLLDRMEVIRLPGYTEDEKLNIAKKYLLPKHKKACGLKPSEISFTDEAILNIIQYYTREAGVRGLDRQVAKISRRVVKDILLRSKKIKLPIEITPQSLEKYLGVKQYLITVVDQLNHVGQVNGLAYTSTGGDLLKIEVVAVQGKGKILHTGQLGDVMKESVQAALSVVRKRSLDLHIAQDFYEKTDLHVHVPEGATPKEGPSAGIGICTALVSALTGIPCLSNVAMTGEITLSGDVLPIGGLKEKLLAARRGGIDTVIVPEDNRKDIKEIPKKILKQLRVIFVRNINQVLKAALYQEAREIKKERKSSRSSVKK